MSSKDIWRLYQSERAATDEEAADSQARVLRDPEEARALIDVLVALSGNDPDPMFKLLLQAFLNTAMAEVFAPQIKTDDATALHCGAILVRLMQATARPERGRPRPGKKASAA